VTGSFTAATTAIRLLLEARKILKKNTPIYAMSVMYEDNYRDLDQFYDFVLNDLKADKLKLNWLQPVFGTLIDDQGKNRADKFYKKNVIRDHVGLKKILHECNDKYKLRLDPEYIDTVEMYHDSVHDNQDALLGWNGNGTKKLICNSFNRNIMVDMEGVARLCFSTKFPGYRLTKKGDLRMFWYGTDNLREYMSQCNQYCGISHSVRRVNATLKHPKPA
jgi:hypothetical protein